MLTNASGDYGNSPGILIKTGAGTMDLSGANTSTGATIVSNGTLQITGLIANGPATMLDGGTLEIDGSDWNRGGHRQWRHTGWHR